MVSPWRRRRSNRRCRRSNNRPADLGFCYAAADARPNLIAIPRWFLGARGVATIAIGFDHLIAAFAEHTGSAHLTKYASSIGCSFCWNKQVSARVLTQLFTLQR